MINKPSVETMTNDDLNRYELVIATSKVARAITDEYCEQREEAETMIRDGKTDKSLASLIKGNIRDKKAVENAVQALAAGEYEVIVPENTEEEAATEEATESSVDYKIGIITGTVSQGEEEYQAAQNMKAKYGDMIVTATYPDNFSTETEQTIATVTNMAADPAVKAIVFVQAVPGATAAINKVKEEVAATEETTDAE